MRTILVVAYACEPCKGSEPGVGWNWVKLLSKSNRIIVLTRKNNKENIETALIQEKHMQKMTKFFYYDLPEKLTFWKKGSHGVRLYYFLWQIGAFKIAKELINKEKIELVYSPTFGNMWLPTFLHKLPCPFVWGPVGGGEGVPSELIGCLDKRTRLSECIRRINCKIPISNPWFLQICKRTAIIVARTEDSLQCIPKRFHDKCRVMIETGVHKEECIFYNQHSVLPSETEDILIIGRLVPWKFVDIGIRAFSKISKEHPNAKLHILGDGECREKLEQLSKKLHLTDRVYFYGNVEREKVFKMLSKARMLLVTSCKEGGSWVLFEAMMCARPIVCIDTSGMHVVVGIDSGIRLPVSGYDELVHEFSSAMHSLLQNKEMADKMGELAYERVVKEFEWKTKEDFFEKLLMEIERRNTIKA